MGTLKTQMESAAYSAVIEALDSIEITTDSTESELIDALDESEVCAFEITYLHEALDVITGGDFPDPEEPQDFSSCETAQDAIYQEARAVADDVYRQFKSDAITAAVEQICEFIEFAEGKGYDGKITVSTGTLYGWAPHNYETESGICIWSDERLPHSYNPELLEGELWALEYDLGARTLCACWTPETETEEV